MTFTSHSIWACALSHRYARSHINSIIVSGFSCIQDLLRLAQNSDGDILSIKIKLLLCCHAGAAEVLSSYSQRLLWHGKKTFTDICWTTILEDAIWMQWAHWRDRDDVIELTSPVAINFTFLGSYIWCNLYVVILCWNSEPNTIHFHRSVYSIVQLKRTYQTHTS